MQVVRLAHETDFPGWRQAARELRGRGIGPDAVVWTVDGAAGPFAAANEDAAPLRPPAAFSVPKAFLDLAERAILHRSDERFDLLYRLLWRLQGAPELLAAAGGADVARARELAEAVGRAAHQMKAFVRFRPVGSEPGAAQVAWFAPAHRVACAVAPFFARRRAATPFSILTPDVCVHWDTRALAYSAGLDPADAPREDALAAWWRVHRGNSGGAAP